MDRRSGERVRLEEEALIKAYEELKALWSFYGQGLTVANWHMNGATEPLDSFFEDNAQGALESLEKLPIIKKYKVYKRLCSSKVRASDS